MTFSVIGIGGKGGRKSLLQINTDIDVTPLLSQKKLLLEDRIRPNKKKKGSLGNERYEVWFRDINDMSAFCNYIKDKL